ncbi:hypothetical protein FPV67DRAFT_1671356 [Lyophyllum atratum]|nr:hypothetical protein FPV67DRAFT_1671356 [Lyophyllum atratum]
MQFSLVLACFILFGAVAALPSPHLLIRSGCDIKGCVAALAPTVVSCAAAAALAGADIAKDAACLANSANMIENHPPKCDQCLKEFNIKGKVKKAEEKVENEAKTIGSKFKAVGTKIKQWFQKTF